MVSFYYEILIPFNHFKLSSIDQSTQIRNHSLTFDTFYIRSPI